MLPENHFDFLFSFGCFCHISFDGIAAYMTRVAWGADAPQPLPSMVAATVAHLGAGALLLAATFVLAAQAKRNLAARPVPSPAIARGGVAA